MQMSSQIVAIQDNFDSEFYPTLISESVTLNPCQERSVLKYSAGCLKSSIEAIMKISRKTCYLNPASGYLRAWILLNGDSRACLPYSGSTGYVSDHPETRFVCD